MRSKEVLVDIDDTIAQTQKTITRLLNSDLGRDLKLSYFTFEVRENLSPSVTKLLAVFFSNKEAVLSVPAYPSALEGVKLLHHAGYEAPRLKPWYLLAQLHSKSCFS
jgi:hypothetical protein